MKVLSVSCVELSCMIPVGIAEDCLKLQFVIDAMDCESPFKNGVEVPSSVQDAIK